MAHSQEFSGTRSGDGCFLRYPADAFLKLRCSMTDQSRRHLLFSLPIAPVALACSADGARTAEASNATGSVDPRHVQFETTDHVATFYRLARD